MFSMSTHLRNPRRQFVSTPTTSWLNFSPIALSPSLWFDASDTTTITSSSGAVSQWSDKSGNNFHVSQATSVNQPVTGSNTINGYNAISFDGNDSLVRSVDSQIVNAGDGSYTAFAVFRPSAVGSARGLFGADEYPVAGPRSPQFLRVVGSDLNTLPYPGTILEEDSAGVTLTTGATYVGSAVVGRNRMECFAGGVTNGPTIFAGSLLQVASNIFVGRLSGELNYYFSGLIGELIVFPMALTQIQHNMVGYHLARKWNIDWRWV